MEYAYATCLLHETDAEINEQNLRAVLAAADCPIQTSRVKAMVAALEDVDLDQCTTIETGKTEDAPVPTDNDPGPPDAPAGTTEQVTAPVDGEEELVSGAADPSPHSPAMDRATEPTDKDPAGDAADDADGPTTSARTHED